MTGPTDGFDHAVTEALLTDDPHAAVREVVVAQRQRGATLESLYEALTATMLRLRGEGREAEEDVLLDVMDQVTGWCSPHARIE
jgi:hypothetical protein